MGLRTWWKDQVDEYNRNGVQRLEGDITLLRAQLAERLPDKTRKRCRRDLASDLIELRKILR